MMTFYLKSNLNLIINILSYSKLSSLQQLIKVKWNYLNIIAKELTILFVSFAEAKSIVAW